MILVTVGMQVPFDRLCKAVDRWAGERDRDDVFIQTGDTDWVPKHCRHTRMIRPDEFRTRMQEADLLIMHAGVGSIVTASEYGIPMLLMPRRMSLHETRGDHQYHAALRMRNTRASASPSMRWKSPGFSTTSIGTRSQKSTSDRHRRS